MNLFIDHLLHHLNLSNLLCIIRLESLNLLFLYLNKCLLEILDDNHKVDEERIQEALECFDAFIGLFVTLERYALICAL